MGIYVLRIILSGERLSNQLRSAGYGVTVANGIGSVGEVKLLYTVIKRKNLMPVMEMIKDVSRNAFFSGEELRSAGSGIFPLPAHQP